MKPLWHQQFWPWFLIALPTFVVIASFVTLAIALNHPDPEVPHAPPKHGLIPLSRSSSWK